MSTSGEEPLAFSTMNGGGSSGARGELTDLLIVIGQGPFRHQRVSRLAAQTAIDQTKGVDVPTNRPDLEGFQYVSVISEQRDVRNKGRARRQLSARTALSFGDRVAQRLEFFGDHARSEPPWPVSVRKRTDDVELHIKRLRSHFVADAFQAIDNIVGPERILADEMQRHVLTIRVDAPSARGMFGLEHRRDFVDRTADVRIRK